MGNILFPVFKTPGCKGETPQREENVVKMHKNVKEVGFGHFAF